MMEFPQSVEEYVNVFAQHILDEEIPKGRLERPIGLLASRSNKTLVNDIWKLLQRQYINEQYVTLMHYELLNERDLERVQGENTTDGFLYVFSVFEDDIWVWITYKELMTYLKIAARRHIHYFPEAAYDLEWAFGYFAGETLKE